MKAVRSFAKRIPGFRRSYLTWIDFLEKRRLKGKAPEEVFKEIYRENRWGSNESMSGPGSSSQQARVVVESLPSILREFGIRSMLDIPCGDFNWLKNADLSEIEYTGADIVDEIVDKNNRDFRKDGISFKKLDLLRDDLPMVDLVFCRDCLVHFSFDDIQDALKNIGRSGSCYLLTTSFPAHSTNDDIVTGQWRSLNLQAEPFLLPAPLVLINEQCTEGDGGYNDKSLCLWKIDIALRDRYE